MCCINKWKQLKFRMAEISGISFRIEINKVEKYIFTWIYNIRPSANRREYVVYESSVCVERPLEPIVQRRHSKSVVACRNRFFDHLGSVRSRARARRFSSTTNREKFVYKYKHSTEIDIHQNNNKKYNYENINRRNAKIINIWDSDLWLNAVSVYSMHVFTCLLVEPIHSPVRRYIFYRYFVFCSRRYINAMTSPADYASYPLAAQTNDQYLPIFRYFFLVGSCVSFVADTNRLQCILLNR